MMLNTNSSSTLIGILQWDRIAEYSDELVHGFFTTMGMYIIALLIGFVIGIAVAIIRHYGGPFSSRLATAYIEFFRGTPLVTQIFLIVLFPFALNSWLSANGWEPINIFWEIRIPDIFGTSSILLNITLFLCLVALSLNSAAYQAEFFRGSMASISAGQTLAAQSIGMTKRQEIRHVMLPQSLRRAIPAWTNEAVYLPKYVTVAYFVGVEDLFGKGKLVASRTFESLAVYALIAIIFLVIITVISWVLGYLYNRMKIPGI
ncbi:MAG: amino acid ABC transporter permease [Candidatus Thorarchaeota archaeon]|jgi:polar amino acid transport system permease protein